MIPERVRHHDRQGPGRRGRHQDRGGFIDQAKKDNRSAGIQPGTYNLKKQMSGAEALAVLVDPDNRVTRTVTIPEAPGSPTRSP